MSETSVTRPSVSVTVSGQSAPKVTVSGGRGPQGPSGTGGTGTVSSVNGATGAVTLTSVSVSAASAVHTHTTTDVSGFTAAAAAAAPVQSVNSKTGAVSLSATDVTAANAVHVHSADDITSGTIDRDRLPVATTKAIGAVQASSGLAVDGNGHLSADVRSVAGRTGDVILTTTDVSGFAAAAAAAAPVQSVNGKTGAVSLAATDVTAAAASHTHAAGDVTSGTFNIARIPTISYTALSDVPASFTPSSHTHDASAIQGGTIATARLPIATATAVGVASASSGLTITEGGAMSANVRSVAGRTGEVTLSGSDVSGVVTTLNSLSGAVAIAAGSNITVSAGGTTVTVASSGSLTASQIAAINLSLTRSLR